jgi:transcriptional regulator with XRE-family HTH domain
MSTVTDQAAKSRVAENVSRLLEERKMSQQALANATGENKMMISRVVRGEHVPGIGLISRIAEAFGVSIDALLSDHPSRSHKKNLRSA